MESDDPVTAYRRYLEKFSHKIDTLSPEDYEAPFRLTTFFIVPSEVEGECLEWTRRYLSIHDCPYGLMSQLSRAVYKHFQASVNLSDFYLESDDKGSSNDDDDDDDDDDDCDNNSQGSRSSDQLHNSNPPQIYASKLLQTVVFHIHAVVKAWSLSSPTLHTPPTSFHVCSHAIKNTRRKMEDRHVVITDLNTLFELPDGSSQAYFAVFDGHGGLEAAEYAATHFHLHLVGDDQFDLDPARAMKQAYKTIDTKFLEKAARENLRCGTTGVSALIRESVMYLGWLGDSQALLVCKGQPVQIMNPHKPEREDERRRIEDLGGCVVFFGAWRVNGNISVSRAIGDAPHKPFISSDADVTSISLTGEEEYLVLACDGLWDVLTPIQVTRIVYKHSHSSPGGLDDVAIGLVNAARDLGSSDNISVVVVLFKSSLSLPQAVGDAGLLLGINSISEKNLDKLSASSINFSNPKPPTLNDKIKSKGKGEPRDGNADVLVTLDTNNNINSGDSSLYHSTGPSHSLTLNHTLFSEAGGSNDCSATMGYSARNLSSNLMETPFSHELMRQALFYIAKDRKSQQDSRLVELALRQAISGSKHFKTKPKSCQEGVSYASYARRGSTKEVKRPSIRPMSRVSHTSQQLPKQSKNVGGKKKRHKRGRSTSLTGETVWGCAIDSDEEWTGRRGKQHDPGRPAVRPSRLASVGKNVGQHKLTPLSIKGTEFTSAALSEASRLASEKHLAPVMELSGSSLPLSQRMTLPGIGPDWRSTKENGWDSSGNHSTEKSNGRRSKLSHQRSTEVPIGLKLGRGLSVLSDTGALYSQNTNFLNLETASQCSDPCGRSRKSIAGNERRFRKK